MGECKITISIIPRGKCRKSVLLQNSMRSYSLISLATHGNFRGIHGNEAVNIFFVPCSKRKRLQPLEGLRAGSLVRSEVASVARDWVDRVLSAKTVVEARHLYLGRVMMEAKSVEVLPNTRSFVVSAGLGYVSRTDLIPPYSLTITSKDPDSILKYLNGNNSPSTWWAALMDSFGQHKLSLVDIMASSQGIAVFALPGSYLKMVAGEISNLPVDYRNRVRLVGAPVEAIPGNLKRLWMPYDDRFDGADSPNPGTLSDFAPRVGRHFIENILASDPGLSPEGHATLVDDALMLMAPKDIPKRRPGTDQEIIGLIQVLAKTNGMKSGETLRSLRREMGWACEQSRFKRLFSIAMGR